MKRLWPFLVVLLLTLGVGAIDAWASVTCGAGTCDYSIPIRVTETGGTARSNIVLLTAVDEVNHTNLASGSYIESTALDTNLYEAATARQYTPRDQYLMLFLPSLGANSTTSLNYYLNYAAAQSAHKFSNDMRLLQHLKELEEPSEEAQVGSSAMPYKENPMRMERVGGLARHVIVAAQNPYFTAAEQWFERTLDDSANKRISIPEMFLATDAILILCANVARGLVVHESVIKRHLDAELPFMATENVLMEAVKRGGNRQELHERIRRHSREAGRRVKDGDGANDMIERIAGDPAFALDAETLAGTLDGRLYVGRAPEQVDEFLSEEIEPLLKEYRDLLGNKAEVHV